MVKKSSFGTFLENELNPAQRKAVTHGNGSILVIAGAGSGKTRVITARITYLIINKNILPSAIVALTFTNKAANEMKNRIAQFLGNNHALPFIGTFHAYCVQLLKKNNDLLPTPFFSILDESDRQKLIKAILQRNNLHKQFTARSVSYQISQMKNHTIDPNKSAQHYLINPLLFDLYQTYEKEKQASKCLDFDDLLLEAFQLFKKNRTLKKSEQKRIKHILVDEYQDTNVIQHALLKQMATRNKQLIVESICAVGDEDQSIYSWRGATITNILNFKKDFSSTKIIKIEQNYRSVQPILDVANEVIQNNVERNPKQLWSNKQGHNRIQILSCLSEYQEAETIAQMLTIIEQKQALNSVAILYRTHTQSRAIEEALIKQTIPYKIIGGIQFYERKEIKDLLAYLRLVANPFDRTSFFRIVNIPSRGLGAKFEEQFYNIWHNQPFLTFHQIATTCIKEKMVVQSKARTLQQFIEVFSDLEPTSKPSDTIEHIIRQTGYLSYLKNAYDPPESEDRINNIKEFIDAIKYFEANHGNTITLFLDDVTLMQEKMNTKKNQQDNVMLMTLHAAKGLEFDTIILSGLEEGLLPTSRALQQESAIEEERRLFYVGITRAKERLLLLHTKYRYTYGQMVDQSPSRFLHEIPPSIPHDDCSYWKQTQLHTFFTDWLGFKKKQTSVITFQGTRVIKDKKSRPQKNIVHGTLGSWKKNQPVIHKKYGTGIVQVIEKKSNGKTYIAVLFKCGIKKILADYLQTV